MEDSNEPFSLSLLLKKAGLIEELKLKKLEFFLQYFEVTENSLPQVTEERLKEWANEFNTHLLNYENIKNSYFQSTGQLPPFVLGASAGAIAKAASEWGKKVITSFSSAKWPFVGRQKYIERIHEAIRSSGFFIAISGRRRVGKTTIVKEALKNSFSMKIQYLNIPEVSDSNEGLNLLTDLFKNFFKNYNFTSLKDLEDVIFQVLRDGNVLIMDEFQRTEKGFKKFIQSVLQNVVDKIKETERDLTGFGGIIILGSYIQPMKQIFEDVRSPLFQRLDVHITVNPMDLPDVVSLLKYCEVDVIKAPMVLLLLHTIFGGIPHYYRMAWNKDLLRDDLTEEKFLKHTCTQKDINDWSFEAENYFLEELGPELSKILRIVASITISKNQNLKGLANMIEMEEQRFIELVNKLEKNYMMIKKVYPRFQKEENSKFRLQVSDPYLLVWLASLKLTPDDFIKYPDEPGKWDSVKALYDLEGLHLEEMVNYLIELRIIAKIPVFPGLEIELDEVYSGYWNIVKNDIEIDITVAAASNKSFVWGSIKRNKKALLDSPSNLLNHFMNFGEATKWKHKILTHYQHHYFVYVCPQMGNDEKENLYQKCLYSLQITRDNKELVGEAAAILARVSIGVVVTIPELLTFK